MRKGFFALAAIALAGATAPASALTIYGLTAQYQGNVLVTFDSSTPGSFTSAVNITGAGFGPGSNTSLFALDSKPGTNQLYALGRVTEAGKDSYSLFTLTFAGAATRIGDIVDSSGNSINFRPENVGFDFNPTNGLLRVVTSGNDNYVLNPVPNGSGQIIGMKQTDVFYPGNNPNNNPNVFGSAYSNNFAGAGSTTLYALDGNGDLLSTQNPPASGQLGVVGALRDASTNAAVHVFNNAGFDIYGSDFALFTTGDAGGNDGGKPGYPQNFSDFGIQDGKTGDDTLYRLDLATGKATKLGNLDRNLTAITAAPFATIPGVPEPATWAMMIGGFGLVGATARRRRRNLAAC